MHQFKYLKSYILVKSPDEIDKLSTPDYTNFIDKAIHILNNG